MVMGHYFPLSVLKYTMLSSADIAEWKLCVCVKRTRFTVQMRRELWHPSTRRREGNERIRSLQASERWSTERLKAKRKNNSLFGLDTTDSTKQQLTCSSCDLTKKLPVLQCFSPNRAKPQEWIPWIKERVAFVRFSWMICSLFTRNPCKMKGYKRQGRQEQAGKMKGAVF